MTQQEAVNLLVNVANLAQRAGALDLEQAYSVAIAVHVLKTPIPEPVTVPQPEPKVPLEPENVEVVAPTLVKEDSPAVNEKAIESSVKS